MYKVLISDNLSQNTIKVFRNNNIEADYFPLLGKDLNNLNEVIQNYDGLAIRSTTQISEKILENAKKLKVIGRAGVGIDNIDIKECSNKGIVVMNTPNGNSITTAEHTIAMMLSLARKIPSANSSTKKGYWEKSKFLGEEVRGKVLGIIGVGNVGSVVANLALGLKMRVLAFDPFLSEKKAKLKGITNLVKDLDSLLENSDFISLHLPLTEKTRNIISKSKIKKIKKGSKLINCARGNLIDEEGILEALDNGTLSGVALDVFQKEPALDNPLFNREDTICTPHLGASTFEAQENVAIQIAEQMSDFLNHGAISNSLNAPSVTSQEAPILKPWIETGQVIGSFAGQIVEKSIDAIEIEFVGKVGQINIKPILATITASLLKPIVGDGVINMVSAPVVARERGINIVEIKKDAQGAFGSYIRVSVDYGSTKTSVAGTIYSDGKPRFIQIDGINLEAEPQKHMIYTTNKDIPGFIGDLGTKLGNLDINIASFALGRTQKKGKAIALLAVDDKLKNNDLEEIRKLPQIINAFALDF